MEEYREVMKKIFILFGVLSILTTTIICSQSSAQSSFATAIKTCEKYTKQGAVEKNNEVFNILITLEKTKNNKCLYKEKIFQDSKYELLTCNFEPIQLAFMSESMTRFNEVFKAQIAKDPIFEAKMTTNGEIFQKYLANPKYCTITHSKK